MRSAEAVAGLVVERGLVAPAKVLDGSFCVEPARGRNGAWLLRLADETLLVKPFASPRLCEREARALSEWGERAPRVRLREDALLVTGTPAGLVALDEAASGGSIRRWQLDLLAGALGRLHRRPCPPGADPGVGLPFDPRLAGADVANDSRAVRVLLRRLQDDGELTAAIDALVAALPERQTALVHGDVRAANVLVSRPSRPAGRDLWLVDWELAGRGDPALDAGAVVALLLEHALRVPGARPDRPAIARWLAVYRRSAGALDLAPALRYAGVRLLQSAVETAMHESEPGPYSLRLAEIGRLCLVRPEQVAVHLHLVA